MRLAIVGAGATGGFLGGRLAAAGADVVLVARGPHLAAMRERGLRIREADGAESVTRVECTDDMEGAAAGADAVFVTLKTHALPAVAARLSAAMRPGAVLVTAQNGIPWWYFQAGYEGPLAGITLESVDPGGVLSHSIPIASVVHCIVYPATSLREPGFVEHLEGSRFTLGEPAGSRSERVAELAGVLAAAGLKAPVSTRIRNEIWLKLIGNAALNPISALARATLGDIGRLPAARDLARTLTAEVAQVAAAVGEEPSISIDRRLAAAFELTGHRTSMLQDLEAGRPLEVGALVGAPLEIGSRLEMDLPVLRTVHALLSLLAVEPA